MGGGRGLGGSGAADCLRACPVGVLLASAGSAWWEATTGGPGEGMNSTLYKFQGVLLLFLTFGGQFCGVVVLWSECGVSYRLRSPQVSCRGNYGSLSPRLRIVGDD